MSIQNHNHKCPVKRKAPGANCMACRTHVRTTGMDEWTDDGRTKQYEEVGLCLKKSPGYAFRWNLLGLKKRIIIFCIFYFTMAILKSYSLSILILHLKEEKKRLLCNSIY